MNYTELVDHTDFMHIESEIKKIKKNDIPVISLCGSTRFEDDFKFLSVNLEPFSIILSPRIFLNGSSNDPIQVDVRRHFNETMSENIKLSYLKSLSKNMKQKIDMSDAVIIVNRDWYIGDSTREEIKYAEEKGIPVFYLFGNRAPLYKVGDSLDIEFEDRFYGITTGTLMVTEIYSEVRRSDILSAPATVTHNYKLKGDVRYQKGRIESIDEWFQSSDGKLVKSVI